MSALAPDEIRTIVQTALTGMFPQVKVVAINLRESEDEDGNDIIDIRVVIEGRVDPARVPLFTREVIYRLNEEEEKRFPIFSFIAKSDLGNKRPDAA